MYSRRFLTSLGLAISLTSVAHAESWWKKDWTARRSITIDTTSNGIAVDSTIGGGAVLVRLHEGNFGFASAKEDGSDIRFVAEDDKTVLPCQIERYDPLMNEAFVWVKLPEIKAGASTKVHLYYGNPKAVDAPKASETYDADSTLVYHFAEKSGNPADATANANNAATAGTFSEGSLIGGGLRIAGNTPVEIANSPSMEWQAGQALTWSAWIKPSALQANAAIFTRGKNQFTIGLNNGNPYLLLAGQRAEGSAPITVNTWHHLAAVVESGKATLYLDGASIGTVAASLPASTEVAQLGGENGFKGELDELQISKIARPAGWIKYASLSQGGTDAAQKALAFGNEEGAGAGGHSKALEHVMLFGDIAKNMMFDGWIAIGVCVIMISVGWTVAVRKFIYLNSVEKGTRGFLHHWHKVSSDLTAIDLACEKSVSTLGGKLDEKEQELIKKSPLYAIYHIGSEEIRHRVAHNRAKGLSARSIQAIKAALDTGMVRALHKLTNGLVYLTISIAGGPYVGLLGTVVGVMITFAIIAKSGEVDVNSIAPGIASALLATVAGLVVAIPALFIYSYLNNRIKNVTSEIQVFIDEFIAKMAEFYPPHSENGAHAQQAAPSRELAGAGHE